jgi:integrase
VTVKTKRKREPGFIPEVPAEWATVAPEPPKSGTTEKKSDLTDARVEAMQEFAEGRTVILHDFGGSNSVTGLRARVGRHRVTWTFRRDDRRHGQRKITAKRIGFWPDMTVDDAREAAKIVAGLVAAGSGDPGRKKSTKFDDAFAEYLDYLQAKADDEGKPARWKRNVAALGKQLILPEWGNWSLFDMGRDSGREAIKRWHLKIVKANGPTSANHCARIIRAIYLRAAKSDDSLSGDPTKLPSAAVTMRREKWQKQTGKDKPGLAFRDFPAWHEAWKVLPPMRRAYHLTNLLTGARPGELARTPWTNLDCRARTLTIGNSKTGNDIPIPLSAAICRALKLARDSKPQRQHKRDEGLIFPGCAQAAREDLPARGHALRRTFKTVALDCGVSDELSAFLLGHIPEGMSAKYALRRMLLDGPTLRKKQRDISRRIVSLLG